MVTWVYRVATNVCLDELRRRARHKRAELPPALEQAMGAAASPERRLGCRQEIERALKRSDLTTMQIAIHTHLDEMTHEEIARTMGLSRKTVWSKLKRLRRRLEARQR